MISKQKKGKKKYSVQTGHSYSEFVDFRIKFLFSKESSADLFPVKLQWHVETFT